MKLKLYDGGLPLRLPLNSMLLSPVASSEKDLTQPLMRKYRYFYLSIILKSFNSLVPVLH